jgi:hypothetical protein
MTDRLGFDVTAVRRYFLGDFVAIATFVVAGEISHGIDPITQVDVVIDTFLPFLFGWLLIAPLLGAYAVGTVNDPIVAVTNVIPAWLVADGVGQVLRDSTYFHGSADPIFYLVAAAVGGGLLVGWRGLAWLVTNRDAVSWPGE